MTLFKKSRRILLCGMFISLVGNSFITTPPPFHHRNHTTPVSAMRLRVLRVCKRDQVFSHGFPWLKVLVFLSKVGIFIEEVEEFQVFRWIFSTSWVSAPGRRRIAHSPKDNHLLPKLYRIS